MSASRYPRMVAGVGGNGGGMPSPHEDPTVATPPGDDTPYTAVDVGVDADAEPAPDVAEEYAESVSLDPSPEQVQHYLELVGEGDEAGSA